MGSRCAWHSFQKKSAYPFQLVGHAFEVAWHHAAWRQAQLAGQVVVVLQAGLLARAEVEVQDRAQVAPAKARVEAEPGGLLEGDPAGPRQAAPLRLAQGPGDVAEFGPLAHRPDRVDERQAGPVVPLLPEVERVREARQ